MFGDSHGGDWMNSHRLDSFDKLITASLFRTDKSITTSKSQNYWELVARLTWEIFQYLRIVFLPKCVIFKKMHTHLWAYLQTHGDTYTDTSANIYIYISWPTFIEDDRKAPFWIATTKGCRGESYSFPWTVPLSPLSIP